MSDNILNIQEEQKRRDIGRDLSYLSKLLTGIKYEEITFDDAKRLMKTHSFKGTILVKSDKKIYKHVSIVALMKEFKRNDSYQVIPLDILVDIWFSAADDIRKRKLISDKIIIFESPKAISRNAGPLKRVLIEVLEARRGLNLNTWLFLTNDDAKATFFGDSIINHVDRYYDYNIKE